MKDDRKEPDLTKVIEDLKKESRELKRDNTLLSYDVATLTNRIQGLEKNVKR